MLKRTHTAAIGVLCFLLGIAVSSFTLGVLESCIRGKADETVTEFENGDFKVLVRSQEFHKSAIRNVDICVANHFSGDFPTSRLQCFLHGSDFSELHVQWKSPREIEVSFKGGRVTNFTNSAIVYARDSAPVEFHTTLCDGCDAQLH